MDFNRGRAAVLMVAGFAVVSGSDADAREEGLARRFDRSGLDLVDRGGTPVLAGGVPVFTGYAPAGAGHRVVRAGVPGEAIPMPPAGRFAARLAPGGAIAFRLDSSAGTVEAVPVGTAGFVPPAVMDAVFVAPAWIRERLAANLAGIPPAVQAELVEPLLDPRLAGWRDEIAFLLASIPAATLSADGFDVRAVIDQAKYAAAADAYLDYVEIRNYEDPVLGQYTTAAYTWKQDGQEKTFELPFLDYYWWVLHPVLDMEEFEDSNPLTGLPDAYPAGMTWREYYLHDYSWPPVADRPGPASYVPHFIFKTAPSREWLRDYMEIPPDSLSGWGPVQRGRIREIDVGAMHLTVDAADRPTTIEFKVRRTGIVLATTLEVERAWAEGRSDLLENMLRYGPGNAGCGRLSGRLLVVRDREPVESSPGVVEAVLDEWNYDYDVVDSTWLADGDLSPYVKIIVPSDQPVAVYQALSDQSGRLLDWLRGKWRILEIHGAVTDASRDWSGIVMPGGFTVEGLVDPVMPSDDYARMLGQPWLNPGAVGNPDTPTTVDLLWDDAVRDVQGGDRFVSDTYCAVDRATWWAGQNMPDSVTDWAEKHAGAIIGRTSQANRVLYQHYGNCGELQDIQTAAFRTMLIPSANTSNGAEDHVWSEFLTYGPVAPGGADVATWHPSGLDWSDGYVNIDNPNLSMSKKFGGGKNISFVTSYRGDGALLNRTAFYAETGHLTVKVTDTAGNPVAGATVMVATETWNLEGDSYPLTLAFWDVTDDDGAVVIETGANIQDNLETDCLDLGNRCNNYYIRVISDIGTFPAENGVALAVPAAEASVGYAKEVTAVIAGGFQTVAPGAAGAQWAGVEETQFATALDSAVSLRCGELGEGYSWCEPIHGQASTAAPGGRLMMLDEANWQKWQAGEPFDASGVKTFVAGDGVNLPDIAAGWPGSGVWYLVVQHVGPLQNRMLLTGDLEFQTGPAVPENVPETAEDVRDALVGDAPPDSAPTDLAPPDATTAPDATSDSGEPAPSGCCSASSRGVPATAILLVLAVCALAFIPRRSRRIR